ncbi:putative phage head-tail adaptor [Serratia symbiotica str. Tucson]|uniref:Phage head-tail adaptor n=2 Tax=Serratia symbiotica TaxID=138074 RepID=A0A455VMX9_9GAMM|nr:head-tail adaptor protein [Serratia symbiotica]EFW11463.1 putative phage head-tail adaptor [Serratia symbiotica str. Tucson]BBI92076.1 phage head-tail adaptor [Serratia symbiotica]
MKLHHVETSATYRYPDPGELNTRIIVRRLRNTPDSTVGFDDVYPDSFKAWAKVMQVGATIYQNSAQLNDVITHFITLRYRRDRHITRDYEVVMGDSVFHVKRVRDLNYAHRFWLLECEESGHEPRRRRGHGYTAY